MLVSRFFTKYCLRIFEMSPMQSATERRTETFTVFLSSIVACNESRERNFQAEGTQSSKEQCPSKSQKKSCQIGWKGNVECVPEQENITTVNKR